MAIKFKADTFFRQKIETVKIKRETAKSVWVEDRYGVHRSAKVSEYENYFDTFDAAKAFLVERAELRLEVCKTRTQEAKQLLAETKAFQPQELKQCNDNN